MHQSIPAVPNPPPCNHGAFVHVVSPRGGASAISSQPGGWEFAYPRATPGVHNKICLRVVEDKICLRVVLRSFYSREEMLGLGFDPDNLPSMTERVKRVSL